MVNCCKFYLFSFIIILIIRKCSSCRHLQFCRCYMHMYLRTCDCEMWDLLKIVNTTIAFDFEVWSVVEIGWDFGFSQATPWLRPLVTGLSLWRPGFAPGSVHVEFMVDRVALGQVFVWALQFFPVSIIPPPWLSILIHILSGWWIIGPFLVAILGHCLIPSPWTWTSSHGSRFED
jgi:hypothetical protein